MAGEKLTPRQRQMVIDSEPSDLDPEMGAGVGAEPLRLDYTPATAQV